jgi:hypothetical protein
LNKDEALKRRFEDLKPMKLLFRDCDGWFYESMYWWLVTKEEVAQVAQRRGTTDQLNEIYTKMKMMLSSVMNVQITTIGMIIIVAIVAVSMFIENHLHLSKKKHPIGNVGANRIVTIILILLLSYEIFTSFE